MAYFMNVPTGSVDTKENWEAEGNIDWDQMVEVEPEGDFDPEKFNPCESQKYNWIEA